MKKIHGLHCILLIDDDEATNFIHEMVIDKAEIDMKVQVARNGFESIGVFIQKR